jgi:hypothetical protein
MLDVAYAIVLLVSFVLGFVAGIIVSRRTNTGISRRTGEIDSTLAELGKQEHTIASGIRNSITTVSGMGDDIQELNTILGTIQARNTAGAGKTTKKD